MTWPLVVRQISRGSQDESHESREGRPKAQKEKASRLLDGWMSHAFCSAFDFFQGHKRVGLLALHCLVAKALQQSLITVTLRYLPSQGPPTKLHAALRILVPPLAQAVCMCR